MRFIKAFVLLCLSTSLFALEELQTKQAIHKIKYISKDGKITYYQKESGEFQMSTNFNFSNLLKLKPRTQYSVFSSDKEERIVISANEGFHTNQNLQKDNKLFLSKLGSSIKPVFLDTGVAPKLHLNDSWLSFYQFKNRSIVFQSFNKNIKPRRIDIPKGYTSYFTPETIMITPNDALYTALNKNGHQGLFLYSFIDNKFDLIYKTKSKAHKIEICLINDNLYIGDFPYLSSGKKSLIISMKLFEDQFKDYKIIYSSSLPDIGNMICDKDRLYFVKTTKLDTNISSRKTEAAEFILKEKKINILSDLGFVSHLIMMNNKLLIPYRGKFLIAKGENKLKELETMEESKP